MLIYATVYNNFEIADMEFWRGEAFSAYFDYLDHNGGFYYEVTSFRSSFVPLSSPPDRLVISQRWGDANVHTMGAALFAGTERIHFFDEIGYAHDDFTHCPTGDVWKRGRCTCDPNPSRSVGTSHATQQITRRAGSPCR
jgi:alpha 1,2-mannosyltransferase